MLRDWIGIWTQATAKFCTTATIAPLDCGPKKADPGQRMPQPCPRKLRPMTLAEVLMKLAESCEIGQNIERILRTVASRILGIGTPDAAALIVHSVGSWAAQMSNAPKRELTSSSPVVFESANGGGHRSSLQRFLRHHSLAGVERRLGSKQHDLERLVRITGYAGHVCARSGTQPQEAGRGLICETT